MVTPEVVRPIPVGQPEPAVKMPIEFLKGTAAAAPRTPGLGVTGPVPVKAPVETVPYEQLQQKPGQAPAQAPIMYLPVTVPAQAPPAGQPVPRPPEQGQK